MIFLLHCAGLAQLHSPIRDLTGRGIFNLMMPWFFFKSGMFYVPRAHPNYNKVAKKMFWPYIVFSFVGWLFYFIYNVIDNNASVELLLFSQFKEFVLYGGIEWNMPLWFLLGLGSVKIIYPILRKIFGDVTIAFSGAIIGFTLHLFITIPYYFAFTIVGLLFYSLGHYFKDREFCNVIFIGATLIYLLSFILLKGSLDVRTNQAEGNYYFVLLITALSGIVFYNNLFRRVLDRHIPILTFIGKHSMIFYVSHYPLMLFIWHLMGEKTGISSYVILCCVLSACMMVIYLISKTHFYNRLLLSE